MQGFGMGRYRPPDADPTKTSFNQGRHPLGDRARKIDQGILVVRFELPFNVWCQGCNNHIGQGVRYNAEKRHVGDYHSTKIWAFRCKCHLCSSWFEIRTDPKNARYVVHEGARQQNQDWNPEENGGHPIYDDSASASSSKPADAFSQLEKRESDRNKAVRLTERMLELEEHNDKRWSDPYTLNSKLRNAFRKEKRVRTERLIQDVELKRRIGWREDALLVDDTEQRGGSAGQAQDDAGEKWKEERLALQVQEVKTGVKALEHRSTAARKPSSTPSSSSSYKTRSSTSSSASRPPSKQAALSSSSSSKRKLAPSASSSQSAGSKSKTSAIETLRRQLIANTRKKQDPFLQQLSQHTAQR